VGPKPAGSDHVDLSAKQGFQVDLKLRVVEQVPAELEVHEDVDVTVRTRLSRATDPNTRTLLAP
jgi:hypothetical protein